MIKLPTLTKTLNAKRRLQAVIDQETLNNSEYIAISSIMEAQLERRLKVLLLLVERLQNSANNKVEQI